MIYTNENDAIRRVEYLQRIGVWTGYYRCPGGWRLLFDPGHQVDVLDSHGYLMGCQ